MGFSLCTQERRKMARPTKKQSDEVLTPQFSTGIVRVPPIETKNPTIQVGTLYEQRKKYRVYPPYQREYVWLEEDQRSYADSLCRGYPSMSFLLMADEDEDGKRFHQMIDGQQRFETIIRFIDGEFRLMTEEEALSEFTMVSPVAPGCFFQELPTSIRNRFLDYEIQLNIFGKEFEDQIEEIFLRINRHKPLTVSERLFIRNGVARHTAMELMKHPFWKEIYQGRVLHRETFQAALNCLALEILGFYTNLRIYNHNRPPINRLVLGDYDTELTNTATNTVWKRLTEMTHLLAPGEVNGKKAVAHVAGKVDIIPLYQAMMLLDEEGFDPLASEKGCLREWFNATKRKKIISGFSRSNTFTRLDFLHEQKFFWDNGESGQRHVLIQQEGLVRR